MMYRAIDSAARARMLRAGRYVTTDQAAYWGGKTESRWVQALIYNQLQAGDCTETRKMVALR